MGDEDQGHQKSLRVRQQSILKADCLPGRLWKWDSVGTEWLRLSDLLSSLAPGELGELAPGTGDMGSGWPRQLSSGSSSGSRGYSESWEGPGAAL